MFLAKLTIFFPDRFVFDLKTTEINLTHSDVKSCTAI